MTDDVTLLRRRIDFASAGSRREAEQAAVKALLKEAFGSEVNILHDPCGRPSLEGFPHFISISHSRSEAVVALSLDAPVGVDVESWREALVTTASKWLTPYQLERILTPLDYLKAWTAKEAIFKIMEVQPPGLIDIPLPGIDSQCEYTVNWTGDTDCMIAIARKPSPTSL